METSVIMDIVRITDDSGAIIHQCNVNVTSLTKEERNAIGTAITNIVVEDANAGNIAGLNIILDSAAAVIATATDCQAVLSEFTRLVESNHQLFFTTHGKETGNN